MLVQGLLVPVVHFASFEPLGPSCTLKRVDLTYEENACQ